MHGQERNQSELGRGPTAQGGGVSYMGLGVNLNYKNDLCGKILQPNQLHHQQELWIDYDPVQFYPVSTLCH